MPKKRSLKEKVTRTLTPKMVQETARSRAANRIGSAANRVQRKNLTQAQNPRAHSRVAEGKREENRKHKRRK